MNILLPRHIWIWWCWCYYPLVRTSEPHSTCFVWNYNFHLRILSTVISISKIPWMNFMMLKESHTLTLIIKTMSCRFIHFIIDTFEFLCCSKLWTKLATTWWCTFDKYTTPQIFRLFRSPGSYNNIVSIYYRMLGMYHFLNNNINDTSNSQNSTLNTKSSLKYLLSSPYCVLDWKVGDCAVGDTHWILK